MSEELELAFKKNNEFKHLMAIPDRVISSYIAKKANNFNVQSRFGGANGDVMTSVQPSFYVPEAEADML